MSAMTSLLDVPVLAMDDAGDAARTLRDMCLSGVHEEAFYVLDVDDVVRKHREWLAKLPRVTPYYAVKANDNETVLQVLAALGTGFDCASKGEMDRVLALGVAASRIVYANPTKHPSYIAHAAALGVNLMTFDNKAELVKIKKLHPATKLLLRIRCDASKAQNSLGMKFGCDPLEDGPRLLRLARDLELDVIGVSFHVGSGCRDPPAYARGIAWARDLFRVGEGLGHDMKMLDLGGGYPGDKMTSLDEMADVINRALSTHFPCSTDDVTVIAEPGRYFVASAFTLATCIHSKRELLASDGEHVHHVMYFINDGVFGSFNAVISYDEHTVPVILNAPEGPLYPSSVWGPSCDGVDKVNDHLLLPEMQIGDWLIYENMGAYTLSVAGTFNGFPVPLVHAVTNESAPLGNHVEFRGQ